MSTSAAVTTGAWSGTAVDAQVAAATVAVGKALEGLGHTVSEESPAIDPDAIVEAMMLGVVATGAALLGAPRRPDRSLLEAVTWQVLAETEAFTALDVMAAIDAQHRVTAAVKRASCGRCGRLPATSSSAEVRGGRGR